MAKIAVELDSAPPVSLDGGVQLRAVARTSAGLAWRELARGEGWSVSEVLCGAGPRDRPAEEQHSTATIAVVAAGSFQYRSSPGREVMTPGSLLLGNRGQYFECGHEHGVGDRCISFSFEQRYLEDLACEAGLRIRDTRFSALRVPPLKELSRVIARVCAYAAAPVASKWNNEKRTKRLRREHRSRAHPGLVGGDSLEAPLGALSHGDAWEEVAVELGARALESANVRAPSVFQGGGAPLAAEARVTRVVRMIESRPDEGHGLVSLAREARLSRYHFLRVFRQITGLTPHRYVRRSRLRLAAARLLLDGAPVLEVALDSGFGDVSNFNHAFRTEFGSSPRSYRKLHALGTSD